MLRFKYLITLIEMQDHMHLFHQELFWLAHMVQAEGLRPMLCLKNMTLLTVILRLISIIRSRRKFIFIFSFSSFNGLFDKRGSR
jgi:hypothetical protein